MTARLMKSSAIADTFTVERTRKPARPAKPAAAKAPASKPVAPRKRAPAAKRTVSKPTVPPVAITPSDELMSPRSDRSRRRHRLAFTSVGLVVLVAASAAGFLLLRGDDRSPQSLAGAPAGVSAQRLASLASSHEGPVYWGGSIPGRKLELTTTDSGTFVRYLPLSTSVGASDRAITVATYPLRNAFATAVSRSKSPQMTSSETAGGGLVVWSRTRPTSVYLAFPGVPHLVEVYAPDATQARTLALSGRIRPVR